MAESQSNSSRSELLLRGGRLGSFVLGRFLCAGVGSGRTSRDNQQGQPQQYESFHTALSYCPIESLLGALTLMIRHRGVGKTP